ncbi:MAG: FMN-binding protein [Caldiserica bacterium]|nr:FMN-binding protein [Caldisericota bacterium]
MRRHPRPLRMLLILVGVLVVCSLVSQVTYGRWLQRTADALAMHSPIISYRYPGIYEGSARVGHVAAEVRVTMGAQGITAIEFLRRPFGKMDPLIDRIVKAGGVPVDVITGATVSSKVVMKAIDDALMKQQP